MSIRTTLGRIRNRARDQVAWFVDDFVRMPRFALFSARRRRTNRRTFARNKRTGAFDQAATYEPNYVRPIQKIVWIYWMQGEAEAPYIVRRCIESWRRLNPAWDVRVLTATTVGEYADLSDLAHFLPQRLRADALRLRLLADHGGVWADATLLCHRPLDAWLPLAATSGFFIWTDPGPDRGVDNWFIASERAGPLISAWRATFDRYITHRRTLPRPYFVAMYALDWIVAPGAPHEADWKRAGGQAAGPTRLLLAALRGVTPMAEVQRALDAGLPMSKLSWKKQLEDAEVARALDGLREAPASARPEP